MDEEEMQKTPFKVVVIEPGCKSINDGEITT
jgi:hypothetical protein